MVETQLKLQALIIQLESENNDRKIAMEDETCSRYNRRVLNSKYTVTEETIKRLNDLLEEIWK